MRSPSAFTRSVRTAGAAVRAEIFNQLRVRGMSAEEANVKAEKAQHRFIEKLSSRPRQSRISTPEGSGQVGEGASMGAGPSQSELHKISPDPSPAAGATLGLPKPAPKRSPGTSSSDGGQVWVSSATREAERVSKLMGPRNAFEEQIQWTKEGKMWPYPINNEYLFGPEEKVSFLEHVYLQPYWNKKKKELSIPHSEPVEHFMELVLNGLSKNPYMTITKKWEHIDWFANYFKDAIEGRYNSVLK